MKAKNRVRVNCTLSKKSEIGQVRHVLTAIKRVELKLELVRGEGQGLLKCTLLVEKSSDRRW